MNYSLLLVCGTIGIGKSALVNSLVGFDACDTGHPADDLGPCSTVTKATTVNVDGMIVTIYDSPGLQAGTADEEACLENMYTKCKDVKKTQSYQNPGETAEHYLTALYILTEDCNYGSLREELMCDRLVVSIRDVKLSKHLQMDPNLILQKAKNISSVQAAVAEEPLTEADYPSEAVLLLWQGFS